MTNYEKITQMSVAQMAQAINNDKNRLPLHFYCEELYCCSEYCEKHSECEDGEYFGERCCAAIVNWLNAEFSE